MSTTSPDKAVFFLDPKAKTFNYDLSSLSVVPLYFFGVNGKPSSKSSFQNFINNNFATVVDRDSAGGADTATVKAGSLSGRLRDFKIADIPLFASKVLRGKYTTVRWSDVVMAETTGYDSGSEFTTFLEKITLRISRKDAAESISDPVSVRAAATISDLFGEGNTEDSTSFAGGFRSGDTSAWTPSAP